MSQMNNMEYEITGGMISKLSPEKIDLHNRGYYADNDDKIISNTITSSKEVSVMDVTAKEYTDQRIDALEKSLDQKLEYQQKILGEKIDHMQTKTEKVIGEKLSGLKDDIEKNRKEDKKFYISTVIAMSAVIIAILGFVF